MRKLSRNSLLNESLRVATKVRVQSSLSILMRSTLIAGLFTAGCTFKKEINHIYDSPPELRAKSKIEQSMHAVADQAGKDPVAQSGDATPSKGTTTTKAEGGSEKKADIGSSNYKIEIKKSALGKEFLLQSSIIIQPLVALGSGLKSRVVQFIERGDEIILLDSVNGNSVSKDIPQNLILAVFPIISRTAVENDEVIKFDFNKGMSDLFIAGDWRASDFEGTEYNPSNEYASTSVKQSYIEEAQFNDNHLVLRQVAKLEVSDGHGRKNLLPTEVKYYLNPYRPTPSFKPVILRQNFDRMGFFEVAPYATQNAIEDIHVSKFDDSKEIVFAISANTPDAFKQAVKDGILYWNKAFGKEQIKVIDAPKGVFAPDLNYNIVQWVDWDAAGFAYADAQMDPRTGENLHAQVYFTSAFAVLGKMRARKLLKDMAHIESKSSKLFKVGLQGLTETSMCNRTITKKYLSSLASMVNAGVDDAKILKAAQDYVREVSAHEIGHTLGLRHNFAGSLATNYSAQDRPKIVKNYFTNGKADDGILTSSSVMEYQEFEESIMTGDQIANSKATLPYDDKAIKTLYLGQHFSDEEIPLFCTDSHVMLGKFADCVPFDVGSSVVEAKRWDSEKASKDILESMMSAYIWAKAPARGVMPVSVQQINLPPPKLWATLILWNQYDLMRLLSGKVHLLKLQRQYPIVDDSMSDDVTNAELAYVVSEMNARGGIKNYIPDIEENVTEAWIRAFDKVIETNKTGIGFNEQAYEFSDAEIAYIKNRVGKYLKQVGTELQNVNLSLLSGVAILADFDVKDPIEFTKTGQLPMIPEYLSNLARKYLLSESGEKQFVEIEVDTDKKKEDGSAVKKKITVSLPNYKYSFKTRVLVAGILKSKAEDNQFWFTREKRKTVKMFDEATTKIFTVPMANIKAEDMPSDAAAQWVLENQFISSQLQQD